nr:MAG TPA: hypothetical protein [Caudoviricetes sp.]
MLYFSCVFSSTFNACSFLYLIHTYFHYERLFY